MRQRKVLGVDIGDVIIDYRGCDPYDASLYEERYSTIPATRGVFEALNRLNKDFDGEVYLVSKATAWAQEKILEWFNDNDFYTKAGIKPENTYFVAERHEKGVTCQRLGITHFVDDRLEVLGHMVGSVPHLYLYQPAPEEIEQFKEFLPRVTVVQGWNEIADTFST